MSPRIPLFFSLLALGSAQTCFWPNGGSQDDTRYQPCSNDTSNPLSHIRYADWDECLPNGLCLSGPGVFWRESCTLSNWEAGGCQDLCSSAAEQRRNDVEVTPCDGSATSDWWCYGNSSACCSDPSLAKYQIEPEFVGAVTTSSLPSSTSSALVTGSSTSFSPSSTAPAPNNDNGTLSTGAKAGIGVGAAIGVIALVAIGILIGIRTQKNKKKKKKDMREETGYHEPAKELPPSYRYEAPAMGPLVALAGDQRQPQEVPGGIRRPVL